MISWYRTQFREIGFWIHWNKEHKGIHAEFFLIWFGIYMRIGGEK